MTMKNLYKKSNFFFIIFSFLVLFFFINAKKNNEYDNIIIYKLKYEKRNHKSNGHSLRYKIIHGNLTHKDINDNFENNLQKFGYIRPKHSEIKYKQIYNKLNSFEYGTSKHEVSCLQTYRDVFIYKKHNKIVKIIKICTSCYANEVITPESESMLLMDFSDYNSLKELFE